MKLSLDDALVALMKEATMGVQVVAAVAAGVKMTALALMADMVALVVPVAAPTAMGLW